MTITTYIFLVKVCFNQSITSSRKHFKKRYPKEVIIRLFENQNEIMDLGISPILIVEEIAKDITDKSDVECNFYQLAEYVPDPRELSSEKKNLMIFDDLLHKNKTHVNRIVRGRHSNVDSFYLAQNYFKLPRQTVR